MSTKKSRGSYLSAYRPDFGEYMEWVCEGVSSRELNRLTGMNHTTISTCRQGMVPGYQWLEDFADSHAAALPDSRLRDPRHRYELFKRAGYTMAEGTPQERLLDWLKSFQERHGPHTLHFAGGAASLTHEQVDALIAFYEAEAEAGSGQNERSVTNDIKSKKPEETAL